MSKLREKFYNELPEWVNEKDAIKCEQIADDFAVKFAEWLYEKPSPFPKEVDLSMYELLQIFKDKYYEK
jgi:hypothetical protein